LALGLGTDDGDMQDCRSTLCSLIQQYYQIPNPDQQYCSENNKVKNKQEDTLPQRALFFSDAILPLTNKPWRAALLAQ